MFPPRLNVVRRGIANVSVAYSEATCAAGAAAGKVLLGSHSGDPKGPPPQPKTSPVKPYDLFYVRVGEVAVVTAVNQSSDEILVGAIKFSPKTTSQDLALRCADVLGTGPSAASLTINFEGGGVVVSQKK